MLCLIPLQQGFFEKINMEEKNNPKKVTEQDTFFKFGKQFSVSVVLEYDNDVYNYDNHFIKLYETDCWLINEYDNLLDR